ncbi:MAG: hypothetical protein FJW38_23575 [Acidobacteria bacterium]|nr:hypothetical protein [Acidobacteriota bacterium]
MKSRGTRRFWRLFHDLPPSVKTQAVSAYLLWSENPSHPSLAFRKVSGSKDLYTVRVTLDFRAVGKFDGTGVTWLWIGDHDKYDGLLNR